MSKERRSRSPSPEKPKKGIFGAAVERMRSGSLSQIKRRTSSVGEPKVLSRTSVNGAQPKIPEIFTLGALQDFIEAYANYGATQTGEEQNKVKKILILLVKVTEAIEAKKFSLDENDFAGVHESVVTYAKQVLENSKPRFDDPIVPQDRSPRNYTMDAIDEMIAVCIARKKQFPENDEELNEVLSALRTLKSFREVIENPKAAMYPPEMLSQAFLNTQAKKEEFSEHGRALVSTVMDYVIACVSHTSSQLLRDNREQKAFAQKVLADLLSPPKKVEQKVASVSRTPEQNAEAELQNGVNDFFRDLYSSDKGSIRAKIVLMKLSAKNKEIFTRLFKFVDEVQKINATPELSALTRAEMIVALIEKYPLFSADVENALKAVKETPDPAVLSNVIKFSQWLAKYPLIFKEYLSTRKDKSSDDEINIRIKKLDGRCVNLLEAFKSDELKAKEAKEREAEVLAALQKPPIPARPEKKESQDEPRKPTREAPKRQSFSEEQHDQTALQQFMADADKETRWVENGKSIPLFSNPYLGFYKTLLDLYEQKESAPDKASEKRITDRIAKLEKALSDYIVKNISKFIVDGEIPLDNKLLSCNLAEVKAIRQHLDEQGHTESVELLDKLIQFLETGDSDKLAVLVDEIASASTSYEVALKSVARYARESVLRYIGEQEILGHKDVVQKLNAVLAGEMSEVAAEKTAVATTPYLVDEIHDLEKQCEGDAYKPLSDLLKALRQIKAQHDDACSPGMADFWLQLAGRGIGDDLIKTKNFTDAQSAAEAYMENAAALGWMGDDLEWADGVYQYAIGAYDSFMGDIENQKNILMRYAASFENKALSALFRAFIAFQHKAMTKNMVEALADLPELHKAFIDADKSPENKEQTDFLRECLKNILLSYPVPENNYTLVKHNSDELVRFEKMYALCGEEQPFSTVAVLLRTLHEAMLRKEPEGLIKAFDEARALLQKLKTEQSEQLGHVALLETMISYAEIATTRFAAGLDDSKDQKFAQEIMHRVVYEGISLNKSVEPQKPTRLPPPLKRSSSLEPFEKFGQALKSQVENAAQVQRNVQKIGQMKKPTKATPKAPGTPTAPKKTGGPEQSKKPPTPKSTGTPPETPRK